MPRARHRSFTRGRGSRRQTEWGFTRSLANILVPANSFVLAGVIDITLFDDSLPLTLVRTRGVIQVQSDQAGASELQIGAVGVAIVTQAAITLGVTAMPDPVTFEDSGIWQTYQAFAATTTAAAENPVQTLYHIDSKAQRKIETGEGLVAVVANLSAATGLLFTFNFRYLFKLH